MAAPITDPQTLKAVGFCKTHGAFIPMSKASDQENESLCAWLGKAIKHEKKLLAACELKFTQGPAGFKDSAKTYLSDKRCLLVALFQDNARRPLDRRKPLAELVTLAMENDILKELSEPARVWQQPKASGNGMRVICSFGPVAGAAQSMVKKLLGLTYEPQNFQFADLTFAEKVRHAMTTINKEGYTHVREIDIKNFFPSFAEETLTKALPLPKEAIRQIVLAKSASWGPHPLYAKHGYISSPPGIPQGSASSAAVADWCIANMPLAKLSGAMVINHADNFFAFSVSSDAAEDVSNALSFGIAVLPGGDFHGEQEQATEVKDGFRMLGCYVYKSKEGKLEAEPTEANYKGLWDQARRQRQRVYGRLTAAKVQQSKPLRIKGLQDYLRFESMVRGWVQAFAFCGAQIGDVKDHYGFELSNLRGTFEITDDQLKAVKDTSTQVTFKWYSGT